MVSHITNHGDHLLPNQPQTPKVDFEIMPPEATKTSNNSTDSTVEEVSLENFKNFRGGTSDTYIVAAGGSGDGMKEELLQINIRMKRIRAEQEKLKFVELYYFIVLTDS